MLYKHFWLPSEAYSETCQASKMEHFPKIINGFKSLTFFAQHSILDIRQGSDYVSDHQSADSISQNIYTSFMNEILSD